MDRPWNDARTYKRESEVKKLTMQDIIDAVEQMKWPQVNYMGYYYFLTDWVKPHMSEEDCIQHFADNGSVIVVDHKGREWHRGVQL